MSCFVLKYFCEIFTCTCLSFFKNIFRSHDAWPGFFIFEGLTCIMPVNFTQKLDLYMSATAKASVKHVPLKHALERRFAVDDLAVRACHSGHARTTLVLTRVVRACQTTVMRCAGHGCMHRNTSPCPARYSRRKRASVYLSLPRFL